MLSLASVSHSIRAQPNGFPVALIKSKLNQNGKVIQEIRWLAAGT
jgi:hypothetical protein